MKRHIITVFLLSLLLALAFGISQAGASTIEDFVRAVIDHDSTANLTTPANAQEKRSGTCIPIVTGRLLHYPDEHSNDPDVVETFPLSNAFVWLFNDVTAICETPGGNIVWNDTTVSLGAAGNYTLAGQQTDISSLAGHKIFLLMQDGTIHTFVCSDVTGSTLTVGGNSYTNNIACYVQGAAVDSSASNESWSHHIDHMVIPLPEGSQVELDGDIKVECSGDVDFDFWTWTASVSIDPFKFTMDMDQITLSVKAAMEVEKGIGHFALEIVPGIFQIDFTPAVFVESETEGELTFALKATEGFKMNMTVSLSGASGINFDRISEGPDPEFENFTVKGEIYTGLAWGPAVEIFEGIAKLAVRYRGGIVLEGQMQVGPWDDGNHYRWHACEDLRCVQGNVHPRIGPVTVDLIIGDVFTQNLLSIRYPELGSAAQAGHNSICRDDHLIRYIHTEGSEYLSAFLLLFNQLRRTDPVNLGNHQIPEIHRFWTILLRQEHISDSSRKHLTEIVIVLHIHPEIAPHLSVVSHTCYLPLFTHATPVTIAVLLFSSRLRPEGLRANTGKRCFSVFPWSFLSRNAFHP